jgi:hypothetical protein
MARWLNFCNDEEFESLNRLKTQKIENLETIEKVSNFLDFCLNFKIQKLVFGKSEAKKLKF